MSEDAGKRGLKEKLFHPFNHKASEKIEEIQDKLANSSLEKPYIKLVHAKHKIGKFGNIVNTNHRHDEEHEKMTDAKREKIKNNHRFRSFAPEREGNLVKWYVDGRDYFWVGVELRHWEWNQCAETSRLSQRRWSRRKRRFTSQTGGYHLNL